MKVRHSPGVLPLLAVGGLGFVGLLAWTQHSSDREFEAWQEYPRATMSPKAGSDYRRSVRIRSFDPPPPWPANAEPAIEPDRSSVAR